MQEITKPDGSKQLVYSYRIGKESHKVKTTLPNNISIADKIKAKAALVEKAEKRSLKSQVALFEDACDIVTGLNNGAGMKWVYDRVKKDLSGPMDMSFVPRYNQYVDMLHEEEKSQNTISNHKSVIQRVLNVAWKRRMIDDIPVRDFGIKREFRDRVLSKGERQKLENVMLQQKHFLYWSIRMSECRPIRSHSDLWQLKTTDLVLFGEGAPYLSFKANKTGLPTICPLSDMPEMLEYLTHGIPDGCPWLFPRLEGTIDSVYDFEGMRKCQWSSMGDPRWFFDQLKTDAEITDFHYHDFKRIATTFMLDNGYTAEDLLDLRFYATREMIDRCYKKRDAMSVLRRISVVPEVVSEEQNAAAM